MQNKLTYLVIGLILLVLIVVAVLLSTVKQFKTTQAPKEDQSANNLNYLATQGKVLAVLVSEAGATPSSIKLNKGEAVNFTNMTKQDLELKVTGVLLTVIKVPAGKSQISPIFSADGVAKFQDAKNTKIAGDITVVSGSATPTSASPAPLFVSKGVITITDNGATPSRADVAIGKSLQIINKTTNDVTLTMTGMVNKSIVVGAGKTISSEVFSQKGQIKAVASNNKDVICIVEVK